MDDERARTLLTAERRRVEALLRQATAAGGEDRAEEDRDAAEDIADPAERLTAEMGDDAIAAGLRRRLDAITRAESRIDEGTYGTSIRSGRAIPDERLEADPAAELTVAEANET